jgi:hypothetical protein
MVVGQAAVYDAGAGEELVLLSLQQNPRRLAQGAQTARFSPDGGALAYAVAQPSEGGGSGKSYVLELATSKVTDLGGLTDPLWEADGKHLRATLLRSAGEGHAARWTSLRARWDRVTGAVTVEGPGSSQIPAPVGASVAWSETRQVAFGTRTCSVFLRPHGGVPHSVVGRFCSGIADDRAVRWSPDGRWLAFPHPGPVPGRRKSGGSFVDVVGIEGGRWPVLSELQERTDPELLSIVVGTLEGFALPSTPALHPPHRSLRSASPHPPTMGFGWQSQPAPNAIAPGSVWFDWSPSGRFLALHDGANDLRVYDFASHGIASLGKGGRPMWSPGGAYLLVLAGESPVFEAFVLAGAAPAAKFSLGPVRDARWLPQACEPG